jgi:hypothetical protein
VETLAPADEYLYALHNDPTGVCLQRWTHGQIQLGGGTLKAAVVYESMYGNTHSVAEAIAEGLGPAAATEVVSTNDADRMDLTGLDLLVVGGPTHAHGMTRSQTRQAAVIDARSGEKELILDPSAEGLGVREWLDLLGPSSGRAAAFDTRVDMPELLTGHASKGIGKSSNSTVSNLSPALRVFWSAETVACSPASWTGHGNGARRSPQA